MKRFIIMTVLLSVVCSIFSITPLQEKMQNFTNENGKAYLTPLIYSMNSSLNSGIFNTAKVLKPFRFELLFNTNITLIPNSDKTFMAKRPDIEDPIFHTPLYEPDEVETATFFGDKGGTFNLKADYTHYSDIDDIKLPDGTNLPAMPFVSPQINAGLPFHTEVMLRYFPPVQINTDIGKAQFLGFGIKHDIMHYFPIPLPVDASIYGMYQNFKTEKVVNINTIAAGIIVGKKLLMFDFYGSLNYNKLDINVDYESNQVVYEAPNYITVPVKIKFSESDAKIRPQIGFSYTLLLLKFSLDASFCKYPAYNLGLTVKLP